MDLCHKENNWILLLILFGDILPSSGNTIVFGLIGGSQPPYMPNQ